MKKSYDVIVIGSGPGGSAAANRFAEAGMKVAMVDILYGGTCALRGCTPKKAMESVTSLYKEASHLQGHGFPHLERAIDWQALIAHQQQFTTLIPANKKEDLREKGIEVIEGTAQFTGKKTIQVGEDKYTASHIVIATGASPNKLPFEGSELLTTSDTFIHSSSLPKRIVFVGGGYIGFELAHMAAAAGSEVTIISRAEKPLAAFDHDLVSQLVQASLNQNIRVKLGFEVTELKKKDKTYQVFIKRTMANESCAIEADMVVHTAGRTPNIEALDLKKADVAFSEKEGIEVNDYLQSTSNEYVYAVGDVIGKYPFTPIAGMEAKVVVENIKNGNQEKIDYPVVPFVLFAYPKISSVGKTEKQLIEEGTAYKKKQADTSGSLIEKAVHNQFAGYKILTDEAEEKILGAHLLGHKADEIINIFAMAMQLDISIGDLKKLSFAYPTAGSSALGMV